MWIFFLLVLVPIIEIALFIQVGGFIGLWPTLGLVVLTALVGTILLRSQGFATMGRLQENLKTGQNPLDPIAHGALILVAGVVLLTPGFFTDAVGLALLIPPIRTALVAGIGKRLKDNATVFTTQGFEQPRHPTASEDVVEAEFDVVTEEDLTSETAGKDPGNSGWTKPKD